MRGIPAIGWKPTKFGTFTTLTRAFWIWTHTHTMVLTIMEKPEIEEFAKILVQQVRDRAIRSCDRRLQGDAKGAIAARWREIITDSNSASIVKAIVPDVVDCALAQLLWAMDQEMLSLIFGASNGKNVSLPLEGSGGLEGSYMGHEGWRQKYSTERFADDFSDLKL